MNHVLEILVKYLAYMIPVIMSAFTVQISEIVQRYNDWLNKQKPWFKQILVATISFIFTAGGSELLVQLTGDRVSDFGLILSALLPYVFHIGTQNKQIKQDLETDSAFIRSQTK